MPKKSLGKQKQDRNNLVNDVMELLREHFFTPGQLNVFGTDLRRVLSEYEQKFIKDQKQDLNQIKAEWEEEAQKNLEAALSQQDKDLTAKFTEMLNEQKQAQKVAESKKVEKVRAERDKAFEVKMWKYQKGETRRRDTAIKNIKAELESEVERRLADAQKEIKTFYQDQFDRNHISGDLLDSANYVTMQNEIILALGNKMDELEEEENRVFREKLALVLKDEYLQEFLEEYG